MRFSFVRACCAFVIASFVAVAAGAQTVGVGAIQGKVTDETGALLPGVTVSIKSPALQLPQLDTVTTADGSYRFTDVPIGTYRVQYELSGFQTLVREDIKVSAGFVARLDIQLKVGALAETVTVSGISPIIDTSTTVGITSFSKETLEAAPTTRAWAEVLAMAPGFRPASFDIGGDQLANQRVNIKNYGTSDQITPQIEGINTRQASGSAGFFYDYSSLEEAQIRAVGNDAEVALPGGAWNALVKSGGNDFHGRYFGGFENQALQSDNLTDKLRAAGVTNNTGMRKFKDFSGDLGGRLVRDELWFYGAAHDQRNEKNLIGFSLDPGPDKIYHTSDDTPAYDRTIVKNATGKGTYQASRTLKAVGFYTYNEKVSPNGQEASRFTPFLATYNYLFPTRAAKGEINATPNNRLLYTVMFGRQWYDANRYPQDGQNVKGNPQWTDRETGYNFGPQPTQLRPRSRWQTSGDVNYLPDSFLGGSHNIKAGYQFYWENVGTAWLNMESGNYLLTFDKVNGVSHQPAEITTYNDPIISPVNKEVQYAGFIQDKWSVGRATVNLGLRLDHYYTYVGAQTKEQGVFGNAGTFPKIDVLTWTAPAPRLGIAYDLDGKGKTVAKSTFGIFNHAMTEDFAQSYNQNARISTRYRWHDLNGNNDYDPGEVDLSLNGPDFISVSGASNNIINPDLQQPKTYELSLGLEREVMNNFGAKLLYVYKRQTGLYKAAGINVLRPYSAYTVQITRRDPGPDGNLGTADDGGNVTLYDYPNQFAGGAFVGQKVTNSPDDRPDAFHTIEVSLNKRMSQKWELSATYSRTFNHRWINVNSAGTGVVVAGAISESPNQDYFPLDETQEWYFKGVGTYELPYGIYTSAYVQSVSGAPTYRTYVFRAVDPAGGTRLPNSATITLPLEPFGASQLPTLTSVNWRASKRLALPNKQRLELVIDLFNALNANTVTSQSFVSGPTYGAISAIVPPRIVRLGVTYSF
jgi:hypothetical protein